MRKFETGATRDNNEEKLEYARFLDPLVLERFAKYMHEHRKTADGMREPDNWKKGIPTRAYIDSLWRHMHSVWKKHECGIDDTYDHLSGILFNVMGLMYEEEKKKL